jgi:hypothetical protein
MGPNSILIDEAQHVKYLILNWGNLMESMFDSMSFESDAMLNYHFFHKLKQIKRGKFNHLTIILTPYILC